MSFVFGPVPSRRLGRSLGIDLVPYKTCSYDCIYCQLGRTTCKTLERKEWVPLGPLVDELREKLSLGPDYITLGGSGEPTLHSMIGELIERIRTMTDIPVAVLTNGSLLWNEEVRNGLLNASLIIPSLDAGSGTMFRTVNRPHEALSFEDMVDGLVRFREKFSGRYWLEVFVLGAHTSETVEMGKIAQHIRAIKPDRVQLNTVTRPPAEESARGVERERLVELAALCDPPGEIIADFSRVERGNFSAALDSVAQMIKRRPCSLGDVAGGLGIHRNEALKYLDELEQHGLIEPVRSGGVNYYRAVRNHC